MRYLTLSIVILALSACSSAHVEIDDVTGLLRKTGAASRSVAEIQLDESTERCRKIRCSASPVLMLVIGRDAPTEKVRAASFSEGSSLKGFTFAGMTTYDGRIKPLGPKYLAYRDPRGNLVCQGYYSWSGFGRTSEVRLRCFEDSALVTGKIRNAGRQKRGRFKGKGVGTGVLAFDGGLVAVVYGVDPPEIEEKNFKELWVKYGGDTGEIPGRFPKRVKKVPLLNKGRTAELTGSPNPSS